MSTKSRDIAAWKYKIMFLGKLRNIIQRCHHVKENVNELKVSWRKSLTKKILTLPTKHSSLKDILSLLRTIARTILVTCSRRRLFLHLNCLKSLRGTYLLPYPHVLTTFVYHCLCSREFAIYFLYSLVNLTIYHSLVNFSVLLSFFRRYIFYFGI